MKANDVKAKYLVIAFIGLAVLGILIFPITDRPWPFPNSQDSDRTTVALPESNPPLAEARATDGTDLNQVVIANITIVPFIEAFDLLTAASPEKRKDWMRQLNEMPGGPKKEAAIASFYKTLVQIDHHAATESLSSLHDTRVQSLAIQAMVRAAPLSVMDEMAQTMVALPHDTFYISMREVIFDWSAVDPGAAARFIERHADISDLCAPALMGNWAEIDPYSAKEWFEQQPQLARTEETIAFFLDGWARHDESGALAYAIAHGDEEDFQAAIGFLADYIFHRSPDDARSFLVRLPEVARNRALSNIVDTTTHQYIDNRFALWSSRPPMSLSNDRMLGRAKGWRRESKEIANWLLSFPQECRGSSVSEALSNWSLRDVTERSELTNWLDYLPSETRDRILTEYCATFRPQGTLEALILATRMKERAQRNQRLQQILEDWIPDLRDDAMVILNEADLSDAERDYFISQLPAE